MKTAMQELIEWCEKQLANEYLTRDNKRGLEIAIEQGRRYLEKEKQLQPMNSNKDIENSLVPFGQFDACHDCGKRTDGLMTCTYSHDGSTTRLCPTCIEDKQISATPSPLKE